MSKLVKERDLKSLGARLTGSSPVPGTKRSLSNKCACGEIYLKDTRADKDLSPYQLCAIYEK